MDTGRNQYLSSVIKFYYKNTHDMKVECAYMSEVCYAYICNV